MAGRRAPAPLSPPAKPGLQLPTAAPTCRRRAPRSHGGRPDEAHHDAANVAPPPATPPRSDLACPGVSTISATVIGAPVEVEPHLRCEVTLHLFPDDVSQILLRDIRPNPKRDRKSTRCSIGDHQHAVDDTSTYRTLSAVPARQDGSVMINRKSRHRLGHRRPLEVESRQLRRPLRKAGCLADIALP